MKSYLKKICNKFKYAFAGIWHGATHDNSIQLQISFGILVILAGCFFSLEIWEWCVIILLVFLVITIEYINSAIEHLVDLVSPKYHPLAKIIKDYAAAAVLTISIMAAIIGMIIFGGKLL